ncbi:hypothetical protein DFH28DRAFT_307366 [Melampsora americana]|nr:hypothetical protein DFH28DRAFT_307366 [Melampsora americana]
MTTINSNNSSSSSSSIYHQINLNYKPIHHHQHHQHQQQLVLGFKPIRLILNSNHSIIHYYLNTNQSNQTTSNQTIQINPINSSLSPPPPPSSSSSKITITSNLQEAHHHHHHHHPGRKASATVSVSGSYLFDSSPVSPRTSFSPSTPNHSHHSSKLNRKQSIDSIWQGSNNLTRHSNDSSQSLSQLHSSLPSTKSKLDQIQIDHLNHLISISFDLQLESNDFLVDLQILNQSLLPWEQSNDSDVLIILSHKGKLFKLSTLDGYTLKSIHLNSDSNPSMNFKSFKLLSPPLTNDRFLSCLSITHSLLIILRSPNLSIFQTLQLDQQASSYLSLVFKNDSTIIGITKTGQIIQHKLQFINRKFSISQSDRIGELNLDVQSSTSNSSRIGIEFDVHSLSSHLIIFTHRSFSVYQLFSSSLNRLLRYTLPHSNENDDEDIIKVRFIKPSLISVLTKRSLKIYQLRSPILEEDETKNKSWRLKLIQEFKGSYHSISTCPSQEDDHESVPKLLAFTEDQEGHQQILKLEPKFAPSVVYSSSSSLNSIEPQSNTITCATWFDNNYELALIGDSSGRLTTQSFPSNQTTEKFLHLNEINNQLSGSITTISVEEDQSMIIVGSSGGDIGIWQTNGTQLAWSILSDTLIESVMVMIKDEVFLAKTSDGNLIIFELKSSGIIEVMIRIPNLRLYGSFDQVWFNKSHSEFKVLTKYCDGVKGIEYQVWKDKLVGSYSSLLEAQNQIPEEWIPIEISRKEDGIDPRKLSIDLKRMVEVATTFYGPSASWISRLIIQELIPWGVNERLDDLIINGLKITPTKKKNRLLIEGLREGIGLGINQTLQVIKIIVSLRLLLDEPSIERITGEVIEEFSQTVGKYIDLGILMKHWFNESIEIKVTVRNLFWISLKSLNHQKIIEIIERWEKYLPFKEKERLKGSKKEKKKGIDWKKKKKKKK